MGDGWKGRGEHTSGSLIPGWAERMGEGSLGILPAGGVALAGLKSRGEQGEEPEGTAEPRREVERAPRGRLQV